MAELKPVKPEEELLIPWVNITEPKVEETKVEEPAVVEEVPVVSEPVITESAPDDLTQDNIETNRLVDAWELPESEREVFEQKVTPSPTEEKLRIPKVIPEDEIKVPEVKVETADKVLTAEEIKANQLSIQTQEEALKTNQNVKTTAEFQTMLTSGASNEELAKIVNANPELRDTFNSLVRDSFKTRADTEYFGKYSAFTNEQLSSAVKSGDIVVWSEQYNLLPEAQRARFEQFQVQENAIATAEDNKNQFEVDNNKTISTTDLEIVSNWFTASYNRESANALLNTPEINQKAQQLEDKQNEIDKINDKLDEDRLRKRIIKQFPWYPAWFINSKIRDEKNDLIREKNSLINEYNSALWTYKSLKDNATNEIAMLQYEDSVALSEYNSKLEAYTKQQERMTDAAKLEFEAANKIKAEDTKFQRDLYLKQFQADLDAKKETWGKYETTRDWALIYLKNWVSTPVLDAQWDVVFTEDNTDTDYKDTVNFKDWIFYTQRTYADWSIEQFTSDIQGKSNSNFSAHAALWGIPTTWLQCWEAVNKYVAWLWNESSKDFWVWDSYESKAKYIDNDIKRPRPWMVAIWNPWVNEKGNDFWHIAVVTWELQSNWMIEITDWNADWINETKDTRMVALSSITNSDWGFYNPNGYTAWQKAFLEDFDGKITKPVLDWMAELWITPEDAFAFKSWFTTPNEQIQIRKATDMLSLLKWMKDLGKLHRQTAWAIQYIPFFWDNEADFRADFNFLKGQLTFENLTRLKAWGATFGALSENELIMIRDSASRLTEGLSNEKWNKEIELLATTFEDMLIKAWGTLEEPVTEVVPTSWYDAYQNRASSSWYDYTKYSTPKAPRG